MNTGWLRFFSYVTIVAGFFSTAQAQHVVRGMVVDSTSREALPNVNILIKSTGTVTISDIRGGFLLHANETDTISFSRVGYHTIILPAKAVSQMVIIFMREQSTTLMPVLIEDKDLPSTIPEPPAESSWRNPTYDTSYDIPGFRGVQTFGPGYVFRMPGSGFKKEAKARKKLQEVQEENQKARDYIHLVNSPEIKEKFMRDYQLTEEAYYRLLAKFNEKNREFIYQLEAHEIVPLLVAFFADPQNRK